MKYKVLVDYGKPYEKEIETDEELKQILINLNSIKDNYAYFDVVILNENGEDISESQFIQEIIGGILE